MNALNAKAAGYQPLSAGTPTPTSTTSSRPIEANSTVRVAASHMTGTSSTGVVVAQSNQTDGAAVTPKPAFRFPGEKTMMHAVKLSISEDKPIMMDYWVNSLQKTALIGVREANNERFLVKSEVENTSPIAKLFNTDTEFIIMTENSIYIVDDKIQRRKIA
jgi:hypothetical protein